MHSKYRSLLQISKRSLFTKDHFKFTFTPEMQFRPSFDKVPCFRVLDNDGNMINKDYENSIEEATLKKIYKSMVSLNEQDIVFNQA